MGGPMMIPLAAAGFIGAVIFLERLLYLHKGQIRAAEFVAGIKAALKNKRLLEGLALCDESFGPIPRVVKSALLSSESGAEIMWQSVQAAAVNEFTLLERRLASIALIAKIAPLLGLMGTVLAMLDAFYTMNVQGVYIPAADFSGQIYSALLSSAFGLIIAIFAWIGYSFLNSRVRALAHDIEWAANDTMLFITRGMPDDENLHMAGKVGDK